MNQRSDTAIGRDESGLFVRTGVYARLMACGSTFIHASRGLASTLIAIVGVCAPATVWSQSPVPTTGKDRPAAASDKHESGPPAMPTTIYRERRSRLLDQLGGCAAVVPATVPGKVAGAGESNRDFYYLSGSRDPDAALLFSPRQIDRQILLVTAADTADGADGADARYDLHARATLKSQLGVDKVVVVSSHHAGGVDGPLGRALRQSRCYAVLRSNFATTPGSAAQLDLPTYGAHIEYRWQALEHMRSVKDEIELARIERAATIVERGLHTAAAQLRVGSRDSEVAALVDDALRSVVDARLSSPAVLASGPGSAATSLRTGDRVALAGDLAIVAITAASGGYHARAVRTLSVADQWSPGHRKLVDAVASAQSQAVAAIRSGVPLARVHKLAERALSRSDDRAGQEKSNIAVYVNSHFIGLEESDVGDRDAPLDAGMVVVIEVGVSIKDEAGVRIADTVLVTPRGRRILTDGVPRSASKLMAWRKARRQ